MTLRVSVCFASRAAARGLGRLRVRRGRLPDSEVERVERDRGLGVVPREVHMVWSKKNVRQTMRKETTN